MTSESLWNYYRHDVNDNAFDGKSFKYETKIVEKHSTTTTTTTSSTSFKC